MNEKYIAGLKKASPEKRYNSFLNTVADREEVWLLSSDEGIVTADIDGYINVMVWPSKEFCLDFQTDSAEPISMEIHEFLEQCEALEGDVRFMVFPTDRDAYVIDTEQLCIDIQESLDEVE